MVQVTVKEHHFESEECKESTATLSSCCVTRGVATAHRTTSIGLCGSSCAKIVKNGDPTSVARKVVLNKLL